MFFTGWAQRAITPPLGTALAGYFEPHYAQEIVNDLYARAFVVRGGENPGIAIVICDVLALTSETVSSIRQKCEGRTGIPLGRIMVAATHTHTGPQTIDMFGIPADKEYLAALEDGVADAVCSAFGSLHETELSCLRASEGRVSCNRRIVLKDGTVHTHLTDADTPEMVGREGPVDPEICVLMGRVPDAGVSGLMVNFALHPTNVRGDRICTDYPGYLVERLRERFGEGVVAVFANGPCGNIDAKTPLLADMEYGPERARRIGTMLGETIIEAAGSRRDTLEGDGIGIASEIVEIPRRNVTEDQLAAAKRILAQAEPQEFVFTRGTRRPSALKERIFAQEALLMAELTAASPMAHLEVQVFRIGDVAIVGLPVELFCEFGLAIKQAAAKRFRHAMIIELANGYLGYVPTRQAFHGGGYETRLARSSQLVPEAGEILVETAARLLERV